MIPPVSAAVLVVALRASQRLKEELEWYRLAIWYGVSQWYLLAPSEHT